MQWTGMGKRSGSSARAQQTQCECVTSLRGYLPSSMKWCPSVN